MKVYKSISAFKKSSNTNYILSIGTFDGVHLAHKALLDLVTQKANIIPNGESVLLTFDIHPKLIIHDTLDIKFISSIEKKISLLQKSGIDHLIIQPFTHAFSEIEADSFINLITSHIGFKEIVIGYNHRFGKNRVGDFDLLQTYENKYHYKTSLLPKQTIHAMKVSSTLIRASLSEGDIEKVNLLLGYSYQLTGRVKKGNQLGKTIGFPTANIDIDIQKTLLPKEGAYSVIVGINNSKIKYGGMLNIGYNPTIKNNQALSIEVHIFDFDAVLYDKIITVDFVSKLRDEMAFESLDDLKSQLEKDKINALNVITL